MADIIIPGYERTFTILDSTGKAKHRDVLQKRKKKKEKKEKKEKKGKKGKKRG